MGPTVSILAPLLIQTVQHSSRDVSLCNAVQELGI